MTAALERAWAHVARHDSVAGVGAGTFVKAGEIRELDAKIRELNVSIQGQAPPDHVEFTLAWTDFFVRWEIWRADNGGGSFAIPGIIFTEVGAQFDAFAAEYNLFLKRANEFGVITHAAPHASERPLIEELIGAARTLAWPLAIGGGLFFLWQSGVLHRLGSK